MFDTHNDPVQVQKNIEKLLKLFRTDMSSVIEARESFSKSFGKQPTRINLPRVRLLGMDFTFTDDESVNLTCDDGFKRPKQLDAMQELDDLKLEIDRMNKKWLLISHQLMEKIKNS